MLTAKWYIKKKKNQVKKIPKNVDRQVSEVNMAKIVVSSGFKVKFFCFVFSDSISKSFQSLTVISRSASKQSANWRKLDATGAMA